MYGVDNKINTLPFNIQVQIGDDAYNHKYTEAWHTTINDGGIKPIFDWVSNRLGKGRSYCIILDKSHIPEYYKLPKNLTEGISVLFIQPSKWFAKEKLMLVNIVHHIDIDYEIDWGSTLCQFKSHTELYNAVYWRTYHKLLDSGISNNTAKHRALEVAENTKLDDALKIVIPDNAKIPSLEFKAIKRVY